MTAFAAAWVLCLMSVLPIFSSAYAEESAAPRIRTLFDQHPEFNEDLLIQAFNEKSTDEFLLTEAEDFIDELLLEFPDWLEKSEIGEPTHEGRMIELVQFK